MAVSFQLLRCHCLLAFFMLLTGMLRGKTGWQPLSSNGANTLYVQQGHDKFGCARQVGHLTLKAMTEGDAHQLQRPEVAKLPIATPALRSCGVFPGTAASADSQLGSSMSHESGSAAVLR